MADGELIFDTKVDTDNFEKGIKDIKTKLKNISTSVESLSATTKKAFDGMSSAQIGLVNSLDQTRKKMAELKSKIGEIESVKVPTEKYTKLQEKVQELKNEYKALIAEQNKQKSFTTYNANSAEAKALDEQIKQVRMSLNKSSIQLSNLKTSGGGFEAQGTTAESAGLREKLNVEESKFIKLNKQLEELNQKEENATKSASKLKNALNSIGKGAKSFGSKISSAFKKSDNPVKNFTKKLTSIGTMLKARVIRGLVTGIANGVKNGFNNLVQYSSKVNQSISGLKSSFTQLNNALATAFMPILQQIAPIIQNIINKIIEAINVVAQFTSRLFSNSTTFKKAKKINEDYAKSLSKTNKEQKKSFSFDTIEKLDSKNDDGSVSPSEMFEEANIESGVMNFVDNVKSKLTSLISVLEPLKQFSCNALKDFYNSFLLPVASWSLGTALPRLVEILKNGLAQIDFSNLNISLNNFFNALAPFTINIGEGLLWLIENVLVPLSGFVINNILPRFFDILAGSLSVINESIECLQPMGEWFWNNLLKPIAEWTGGVILDVLDGIINGLNNFSTWISNNQELVENLVIVIGSFATAFGLVNLAIGLWNLCAGIATGVTTALGAAITFLTSPIGIVVIAIGALIAIVALLIKNWDKVKETAQNCWNGICDIWNNAKTKMAEFGRNIVEGLLNGIKEKWENLKNSVKDLCSNFVDGIKSFFGIHSPSTVFANIGENITAGVEEGIGDGNGAFDGLNSLSADSVESMKTAWSGIAEWFSTNVTNPLNNVFKLFSDNLNSIFDNILNNVKNTVIMSISMMNIMIESLESAMDNVVRAVNRIIASINATSSETGISLPYAQREKFTRIPIPKLATGTVVPANYGEFAAILGDNKRETEVVSPLSTMKQALIEALAESGGQKIEICFEKSNAGDIVRYLWPYVKKESKRIGNSTRKSTGGAF